MNIPFDISPLNPDNVVSYYVAEESGFSVAYIKYKEKDSPFIPLVWNVRHIITRPEMPYKCNLCGNLYISPNISRCKICGGSVGVVGSAASADEERQDKPKLNLRYFEKINAKDKLINLCGRSCLVLGTAEAADTQTQVSKSFFLLAFYDFYQNSASVKFEVLQYFYYEPSNGKMFVDGKLNELNKILFEEITKHNFSIVPKWNVAKISEIYLNRSV